MFQTLVARDPDISNFDIALAFKAHFERVDDGALEVIWQWRRPESDRGAPDWLIDDVVRRNLREAGYLFTGSGP